MTSRQRAAVYLLTATALIYAAIRMAHASYVLGTYDLGLTALGARTLIVDRRRDRGTEGRTALERAAAEQGVPLVCDVDALTAPEDERLTAEEFAKWSAWRPDRDQDGDERA